MICKKVVVATSHGTRRCVRVLRRLRFRKGRTVCGDCGSDHREAKVVEQQVYDPAQLKDFYERNMFSIILAWHCGLTIGFSLPTLLAALVYTKNRIRRRSLKRYLNTGAHPLLAPGRYFDHPPRPLHLCNLSGDFTECT